MILADRAWLSRCEDFEQSVLRYKSVRFSRFVTPHEVAVFRSQFHPSPFVSTLCYGGAEDAERVMIGFFPDYLEPDVSHFPITPILLSNVSGLTHRDILGAVLGLGIKREMIGDIYVDGETAVLMCDGSLCDYVLSEIKTVGRNKVEVSLCPEDISVSLQHPFTITRSVIASLRLDALVGAAAHVSRSEAQSLISGECVSLNFCVVTDASKKISEGDVLSVRKHGRFVLERISGETKKGRIAIELKKYI